VNLEEKEEEKNEYIEKGYLYAQDDIDLEPDEP
jgi:hypothetical protein